MDNVHTCGILAMVVLSQFLPLQEEVSKCSDSAREQVQAH